LHLLGHDAVLFDGTEPTCERNTSPQPSAPVIESSQIPTSSRIASEADPCLAYFSILKTEARFSPKVQVLFEMHNLTTHKTMFFIITALRASYPKSTVIS
jgi:hypothetical protein